VGKTQPMYQYEKLTIKQLAVEDRPREKMLHKGISSLSDAELIAILLGSGSPKESAVELARKIMAGFHNNLNELGKADIDYLRNNYYGVGEAKAITIVAAMELGRRRLLQESLILPSITCSNDVYRLLKPTIADLPHEEFWILMLNRANKVILRYNLSKGGLTGTVIDVRLIMKKALEARASSIIISHNHPSGNLQPSESDTSITKKIKEAGKVMEIPVLDHIIVTDNGYFSFADEGLI
jgi:DNA repair protein RadC